MHGWELPDETARPRTSLILPAYNPGAALRHTWNEIRGFLRTRDDWEVLFVCDGCTDETPQRLAEWTRGHGERVRVVSYPDNRGKGHAVQVGLAAARGQWRLFTDIDLAYGFADIERVAASLWDGADVAIGSRAHPESRLLLPPQLQGYCYRRHLQGRLFGLLARLLLPLKQRDTQAGLKGLSAAAVRLVLPYLRCTGFAFDCELLTACAHFGLSIAEVPVCVRCDDAGSTTGLRGAGRMLLELWRIRRRWRRWPAASPRKVVGPLRVTVPCVAPETSEPLEVTCGR